MASSALDFPEDVVDLDELDDTGGHRHLDDIWQYYKKIKLDKAVATQLHRNYSAQCKTCGVTMAGKPQGMRKHTSNCTLHALREQAKQGDSGASCSQTGNAADSGNTKKADLDRYVDRVRVTPGQWRKVVYAAGYRLCDEWLVFLHSGM